jgi:ATP-dependent Clp protease, protease subunit
MPDFVQIVNAKEKGKIIITGYLTPWENSAAQLTTTLAELEKTCSEIEVVLLNCYGGSIFEGIPTFNAIKNCKVPVTTIIEGLAASMGGILFLAGKTRLMADKSRLMLHRAQASCYGDAEDLMSTASLVEDIENDLIEIVDQLAQIGAQEVKSKWFKSGVDTYLTVDEAIKTSLCTGKANSMLKIDAPKNLLKTGKAEEVAKFYAQQISPIKENLNTIKMSKLTLMAAALNLAAEASEIDVLNGIEALNSKVKDLEKLNGELNEAAENLRKDKVNNLIRNAVETGKIGKPEEEHYRNLANKDYESVKSILDAKLSRRSLGAKIDNKVDKDTDSNKRESWDFKRYQKEDPKALAKMQKEDPDAYAKLKQDYLDSRS